MQPEYVMSRLMEALYVDLSTIPSEDDYYYTVLHELDNADLRGQFYHLLRTEGLLEHTPTFFRNELYLSRDRVLFQNIIIKQECVSVLRSLERAGVNSIWLKGTRFAERYFGNIGARATTDLDVLVMEDDTERALSTIRGMGYAEIPNHSRDHFHIALAKPDFTHDSRHPFVVEVHHQVVQQTVANVHLGEFLQNAQSVPGFSCVHELSDLDTLYYTCLHAGNHGVGHVKHLFDILHLICRSATQTDMIELVRRSRKDETFEMLRLTLSTVYDAFPFLHRVQPLPQEFIFPLSKSRTGSDFTRRLTMLSGWRRKTLFVARKIFPRKVVVIRALGLHALNTQPSLRKAYYLLYLDRCRRLVRYITGKFPRRRRKID